MDKPLDILYIDNHLIILNKPAGLLVQGDKSGNITLFELAKRFLKRAYNRPGDVFLGLVHRLDKPVSGIVVFARTSKAASRLSEQIRQRQLKKSYIAIVEGKAPKEDVFIDYLQRCNKKAVCSSVQKGKYSELSFKRLRYRAGMSVVEIELKTGRYHQIRAQFASRQLPIIGDAKYSSSVILEHGGIALHASAVSFQHPARNELITITSYFNDNWA